MIVTVRAIRARPEIFGGTWPGQRVADEPTEAAALPVSAAAEANARGQVKTGVTTVGGSVVTVRQDTADDQGPRAWRTPSMRAGRAATSSPAEPPSGPCGNAWKIESRRRRAPRTIWAMILGDETRGRIFDRRRAADVAADLRAMALHLETAAVLDGEAGRTSDPAQVATLRSRAAQRRRQAARIRARLAADGAAVPDPVRLSQQRPGSGDVRVW
jgi:hypothetical protein